MGNKENELKIKIKGKSTIPVSEKTLWVEVCLGKEKFELLVSLYTIGYAGSDRILGWNDLYNEDGEVIEFNYSNRACIFDEFLGYMLEVFFIVDRYHRAIMCYKTIMEEE